MPAAKSSDSDGDDQWNFTRHLLALFRVPPPPRSTTTGGNGGDDDGDSDSLYPSNMRAFVRAMLPALRLCTGVDVVDIDAVGRDGDSVSGKTASGSGIGGAGRSPTFFFAVLVGWSQAAQAALLPAPDDAIVDDAGRVLLTWLVSCDSAASFGRLAGNDFVDGTTALCTAVPHGIVPAGAPRIDYVYGTLPAALLPVLKDLYVPSADATDVNGVDNMYVHLSDAAVTAVIVDGTTSDGGDNDGMYLNAAGRGRSASGAAAITAATATATRGRNLGRSLLPPSATRRALSAGDAGVP